MKILLSKREIRTGQELMNFLAVKTDPDVAFVNQEKSIGVSMLYGIVCLLVGEWTWTCCRQTRRQRWEAK